MLRPYKFNELVFGPAESSEGVVEAGEGQADNVKVAAFDARDVAASAALDGVGASLIVGLAGGEITGDFFRRKHGEVDQGGLDEGQALGGREADEGDSRDDGVGAAGEFFEHVAGGMGGGGRGEDVGISGDLRGGGQ